MSRPDPSENRRSSRSGPHRAGTVLAAAAVVLVAAAIWYGVLRWRAGERIEAEGRRLTAITDRIAIANRPLSAEQFAEALALTGSDSPEIREMALRAAAADVRRHHPGRRGRVAPVAARLTADPDAAVRRTAAGVSDGLKEGPADGPTDGGRGDRAATAAARAP